jgi:hypothetical protein
MVSDGTWCPCYKKKRLALIQNAFLLFFLTPTGGWGNAWRDHREFVGTLEYATRYKLWTPLCHELQGNDFQRAVTALLSCQRIYASPVSMLPDECLYYIVNMCRWDWFGDSPTGMRARRRMKRRRELQAQQLQREQAEAEAAMERDDQDDDDDDDEAVDSNGMEEEGNVNGGKGRCCLRRRASSASSNKQVEDFHDAEEEDNGDDLDLDAASESYDEEMENDSDVGSDVIAEGADDAIDDEDEDDDSNDDDSDEDDSDDDDDDDTNDWEHEGGYRANIQLLSLTIPESDDEGDGEAASVTNAEAEAGFSRQAWFRRNVARIHILRAMAAGNNIDGREDGDAEMGA